MKPCPELHKEHLRLDLRFDQGSDAALVDCREPLHRVGVVQVDEQRLGEGHVAVDGIVDGNRCQYFLRYSPQMCIDKNSSHDKLRVLKPANDRVGEAQHINGDSQ